MADQSELVEEINELKSQRHAIILAHNYQLPEIQDIADALGDSLGLSRQAAATDAETIVFCGVHFMAESAKLLCPDKTVLMPDTGAGCPMADMITADQLREFKAQHPGAPVVAYVNTTAAVKAESDICCTSSNSVQVVRSLPEETILFVPDINLGDWTQEQVPEKNIIRYPGHCAPHLNIRPEFIRRLKEEHPEAVVMAHPECVKQVRDLADVITSTGGMVKFAAETDAKEMIVGTEQGLVYRLQQENPDKTFYPIQQALCPNMKKTTLPKVLGALKNMTGEITIAPEVADKARRSVERMIELG